MKVINNVQLDNGTCGQNIQIGADPKASSNNKPSFLLYGDGGLSKYAVKIDGQDIGQFASDGFGNVCILATAPLADGPHTLTATEVAPNPTKTVPDFQFSVDTQPPVAPTTPLMSTWSDSGLVGDLITKYRSVNFTGTATGAWSVQLYAGLRLIGGSSVDQTTGRWSATTVPLDDGVYTIHAISLDKAGNKSPKSATTTFTVSQTGLVAPGSPVASPLTRSVTISWSKPTSDGGSPITRYNVYRDSAVMVYVDATVFSWTDPSSTPGATYSVSAVNAVGESPKTTVS